MLGLTFKENVPDLRNSRVIDIVASCVRTASRAIVHDPVAPREEASTSTASSSSLARRCRATR